jgi:hypothetical protein
MADRYKHLYKKVKVSSWKQLQRYSEGQGLGNPGPKEWNRWVFKGHKCEQWALSTTLDERYLFDLNKACRMRGHGSDASVEISCERREAYLPTRRLIQITWNGLHSCSITVLQRDYMTGPTPSGLLFCSLLRMRASTGGSLVQFGLWKSIGGVMSARQREFLN